MTKRYYAEFVKSMKKMLILYFSGIFLLVGAVFLAGGTIAMTIDTIIQQQNLGAQFPLEIASLTLIVIGITIVSVGTIGIVVGKS